MFWFIIVGFRDRSTNAKQWQKYHYEIKKKKKKTLQINQDTTCSPVSFSCVCKCTFDLDYEVSLAQISWHHTDRLVSIWKSHSWKKERKKKNKRFKTRSCFSEIKNIMEPLQAARSRSAAESTDLLTKRHTSFNLTWNRGNTSPSQFFNYVGVYTEVTADGWVTWTIMCDPMEVSGEKEKNI